MNDIQIFNNPDFGEIRTVIIDGEPWFVSKDISDKLGYAKPANMVKLIDEDDKGNIQGSVLEPSAKTPYKISVINESGLYAAIFGSKQENAKKFKKWVTSEVLPSIRKTGEYKQNDFPRTTQAQIQLLAQGNVELNKRVDNIQAEVKALKDDMPVFLKDTKDIQNALRKKAIEVLGGKDSNAHHDRSIHAYTFADIQIELRRQFNVKRYDQIRHKNVPDALKIIEEYNPPLHIRDKIAMANAQQSLDLEGGAVWERI